MADVGVVMGTRSSRYSADAANVLIPQMIERSRRSCSGLQEYTWVAMQNLTLLAAIKLVVLAVLALIGLAQMWMAVVVDAVLTLTVFNTSRLLGSKPEISEE